MKHSKWRRCDDFVKLSRCVKIFQSLSIQLTIFVFIFLRGVLLIVCLSSGVARRLVQRTCC